MKLVAYDPNMLTVKGGPRMVRQPKPKAGPQGEPLPDEPNTGPQGEPLPITS